MSNPVRTLDNALGDILEHGTGERRVKPRPARINYDVGMHAVVVAIGSRGDVAVIAADPFDGSLRLRSTPEDQLPRVAAMLARDVLPGEGANERRVLVALPAKATPAANVVLATVRRWADAAIVEEFSARAVARSIEEVTDLIDMGLTEPWDLESEPSETAGTALSLAFAASIGHAPECLPLLNARRDEATAARARAAEYRQIAEDARAPIPSRFTGENPGRAHAYTRRSGGILAREIDEGRRAAEAAEIALVGGILAGMAAATNSEQ